MPVLSGPLKLAPSSLGPRRLVGAIALSIALSGSGCSTIRPHFWTAPDDYHAYRAARVAEGPLPRLRAQRAYLQRFPQGAYRQELEASYEREEERYYAAHNRTKPGLEEYLATLPDGPHTMDASLRLADLKERSGEAGTERLVARSRAVEEKLRLASENRKLALENVSEWIADLASLSQLGTVSEGLPSVQKGFDAHFRRASKPPACTAERCLRLEAWPYQVPVEGGGLDELEVTLQITLRRAGDTIRSISVHGPGLFSRAWEASRGLPLPKDAVAARAFAVGYASELVLGTFGERMPATCDVPAAPPIVLRKLCRGLELTVSAGDTPADDDAVTLSLAPR